ncbi:hypothetical protein ILUMI_25021 [Ignelater luminosus]|uniref:Uncharacterized protein n=1 Tax=Ignelater luminosus TaxID=2038154 RepID=A0A8K0C9C0_IGNLU|nr:hypothetical protein ILUMI_25021 [Ignelater luminosus]
MKLLAIFLVCFFAGVFSQQLDEFFGRMETLKEGCISESSVRPELVDRLFEAGEFNEDGNLKCFIKCIFVKMNAMSPAGDIQVDNFKSQFPAAIDRTVVNEAVETCKSQTGVDACDRAFNLARCSLKAIKLI